MSDKTDTPETDLNERENGLRCSCADNAYELARKLERERDEARRERDELRDALLGELN